MIGGPVREEDTTAQIHREMLERTSAHLEHVDRLRLSRSFWLVLAAIIAFSIWCGIVVVQVVSDRGAVSRRGEWLLAAQAIDQRLIGQAADDHPEPMVLGASVVELRELSRRVVDDPSADKLAAALDDAIELSMRGADQIRVGELRESIARFTAICRQESGELSTRLGDR